MQPVVFRIHGPELGGSIGANFGSKAHTDF